MALNAELDVLRERLEQAKETDREALADWHAKGSRGKRPEPAVPMIEKRIEEVTADRDALVVAVERAYEEKERYVEKHRDRLVRDATKAVEQAHGRYLGLVAELEVARQDLSESRASVIWAKNYPSEAANQGAPTDVAGGLARPMREAIGVPIRLAFDRLLGLLRADGEFLATIPPAASERQDVESIAWANTLEGQEQLRRERREAREEYERVWGRYPDW